MIDKKVSSVDTKAISKNKAPSPKIIGIIAVLAILVGIAVFLMLRGKPATDIYFHNAEIHLMTGDAQRLSYEILPSDATTTSVEWQSSNPAVAKVDETGKVTAISAGEAVIMVRTANGKMDECLVIVKPTAFDYLKDLDEGQGYTVGNYSLSNGASASIGFVYNRADDSILIMNISEGPGGNGNRYSGTSSITIPKSLSGDYQGYLEFDYGFDMRYGGVRVVHSTYLITASTFTSNSNLKSNSCDGASYQVSENEEIYVASLQTIITKVYQEILEPNGYTYADLGFNSYN